VIAKEGSGTPLYLRRFLAPEVTKQLRFMSDESADGKAPRFVNDHQLDRQTTRGVRELTVESAALLSEIIQVTENVPRTRRAITITIRMLREYRRQRELAPAFYEENRGDDYSEGSLKSVLVNRYERDPEARRLCIRHHGTQCNVCGLDFGRVYGEFAAGFIHVHHLTPISSIGRGYRVNPAQDLRPLCPNCHAVIHLRTPPYSIEELRELINSPH
jgi:hypothetical protein